MMRCTCGRDRIEGSILCQMVEAHSGLFSVEIYDGRDMLLAKSHVPLPPKEALDFIDTVSHWTLFNRHFHWQRVEGSEPQSPQVARVAA